MNRKTLLIKPRAGAGLLCRALSATLLVSAFVPLASVAQLRENTGPTTILPTDIVPLQDRDAFKTPVTELLQLKMMQRLPSKLYFSAAIELTMRDETNPFQFPTKRALMAQLPRPAVWRQLNAVTQAGLYDVIGQVARNQLVFRSLPNLSMGWNLGSHTRIFTNYFMIRDQLTHNMRLNTVIHSYAVGLQHDKPIGPKGSLQFEFQGRELWQLHQQSVFDFLPSITYTHILTPRTVLFVNALMQLRGKAPFQAPTKEMDPFYTWGGLYQKNGWTFTATSTLVQNFRQPFHSFATIPKNNYVLISDFEIARRMIKQYPGLQAFIRAEPIWNFHAHNLPSLSGMDFRLFFGMRYAMAKPALTATLNQIREQLKQETEPEPAPSGKPSASVDDGYEISLNPQPIHGFLETDSLAETCNNPFDQSSASIADSSAPQSQDSIGGDTESGDNKNLLASKQMQDERESGAEPETETAQSKTLEQIAQASLPDLELRKSQSEKSPEILDISQSNLDWSKFETPANLETSQSAKSQLHSVLETSAKESNALAQAERSKEIKDLQDKQEREYKIAFAPAPIIPQQIASRPAPSPVPVAVPVPPPASMASRSASLPPHSAPLTNVSPRNQSRLEALPAPNRSGLSIPQPASLASSSPTKERITGPASLPQQDNKLAVMPELQAPVLRNDGLKRTGSAQPLQPLKSPDAQEKVHVAAIQPGKISKKPSIQEPVQISSNLVPAANKVPSPVAAQASIMPISTSKRPAFIPASPEKSLLASASVPSLNLQSTGSMQTKPPAAVGSAPAAAISSSQQANAIPRPATSSSALSSAPTISAAPTISSAKQVQSKPVAALVPARIKTAGAGDFGTLVSATNAAPKLRIETPEISVAVSSLSENEIASPKIAMAAYGNWFSPVIDDPLIEAPNRNRYTQNVSYKQAASESGSVQQKNKKGAEKSATSMKLIPPFPSTTSTQSNSKDNPLQNLKLPVMPLH